MKFQNLLLTVIATLFSACTFANNSSDTSVETRTVSAFTAVSNSGPIDIYLIPASSPSVKVVTRNDDPGHVKTDVSNGTLDISYTEHSWWSGWGHDHVLKVYVYYTSLNSISASGSGDVYASAPIKADKLTVQVSGSSDAHLTVEATDLVVSANGSSDIYLNGTVSDFGAEARGSSDIKAADLHTDVCSIHASGSSDCYVNVAKALSVSASGSSDVYYSGSPQLRDIDVSGSSDLHKKD
jgi:hypothetical protein